MSDNDRDCLSAAIKSRLSDLADLAERLDAHAGDAVPALLLARLLVATDRAAAALRRHAEAISLAARSSGGAR
jgi:hypothetical protein